MMVMPARAGGGAGSRGAAEHVSSGYRLMASAYYKRLLTFTPTLGHVGNVEIGGRVSRLPLDQSERSCSTL